MMKKYDRFLRSEYQESAVIRLNALLMQICFYSEDYFGRNFFTVKEKQKELFKLLNNFLKDSHYKNIFFDEFIWHENKFRKKQVKRIFKDLDKISEKSMVEYEGYLDDEIQYQRQKIVRLIDVYRWCVENIGQGDEKAIFIEKLIIMKNSLNSCLMKYDDILSEPFLLNKLVNRMDANKRNYLIKRIEIFQEILEDLVNHEEGCLIKNYANQCIDHLHEIQLSDDFVLVKVYLLLSNAVYDVGRYVQYKLKEMNKDKEQHEKAETGELNEAIPLSPRFSSMLLEFDRVVANLVSYSVSTSKNLGIRANFMSVTERSNSIRRISAFKSVLDEIKVTLSMRHDEKQKIMNCLRNLDRVINSNDATRFKAYEWLNQLYYFPHYKL